MFRNYILLLGCLFLLGCSSQKVEDAKTQGSGTPTSPLILAQYHLVTWNVTKGEMVGIVRAITPIATTVSPKLNVAGQSATMTARMNPDSKAFPVTVWEALVPIGAQAVLEGQSLPLVNNNPQNITVVGDTGCYANQTPTYPDWPYPNIIAKEKSASILPDLVVHVGDFNYRGTPHHSPHHDSPDVYDSCGSDYQHQDTKGMAYGDDWATWQIDFFDPSADLFMKAPWVVTRGNHELCTRAGTGWFYLMDAGSTLLDANYQVNPCQSANTVAAPAYALAFQSIQLVVIDSVDMCDFSVETNQVSTFTPIFKNAIDLAQNNTQTASWMVTHKPLFSYNPNSGDTSQTNPTTVKTYTCATMDKVLGQSSTKDWYQYFSMLLVGHVHHFQFIKPSLAGWPSAFVVGNSGVALANSSLNGPVTAEFKLDSGHFQASGSAYTKFGYLTLNLSNNQWLATFYDSNGVSVEQFTP